MIKQDVKFDFDDLLIVPGASSAVRSRKRQVNVYDEDGMLPLFTAPMDTVIGVKNLSLFKQNKIYPIIPRTSTNDHTATHDKDWRAVGLKEFEELTLLPEIINQLSTNDAAYELQKERFVLADIANGHMQVLEELVKKAKGIFGDKLHLMVGNVANPETYRILSDAGADYIRIGIGNGGGCWIQGTKVLTKNGYKNIEDICTDDEVLTHTGEWKSVILTHELDYYGDFIDINGEVSTEDHQYFVVDKKDANLITDDNYLKYAYWINAIELTDEHLLLEIEKNDL